MAFRWKPFLESSMELAGAFAHRPLEQGGRYAAAVDRAKTRPAPIEALSPGELFDASIL